MLAKTAMVPGPRSIIHGTRPIAQTLGLVIHLAVCTNRW